MLRKLMMCVCMLLCVPADAAEWLTDIPTAQQRAAEEGKKVLVVFTGTDWCLWCIHLKNQIFTTPAFREFAKEQLVPVEIDIPRNRALVGGEENYKKNRCSVITFAEKSPSGAQHPSPEGVWGRTAMSPSPHSTKSQKSIPLFSSF